MDSIANSDLAATTHGAAHRLHLYEHDDELDPAVVEFLAAGLAAGEAAIWIGMQEHRRGLMHGLTLAGVDVAAETRAGTLVVLDAAETLALFMRDGHPDPRLFERHIATTVAAGIRNSARSRVRAFGEMVDVLWRRDEAEAALRLEALWHQLQQKLPFSLMCAYSLGSFASPLDVRRVCEAHDQVCVPAEHSLHHRELVVFASDVARRCEVERALTKMREELRRSRCDLEDHRRLLSDCLENAAIGLHFVGADGTILWANNTELELLGYHPVEYIGRNIADFHVDPSTIADIMRRLTAAETIHDHRARVRAKDGSIKHVAIDSNVLWKDGEFKHTRCFTRDVTEQTRRAQLDRVLADATALLASALDPQATFHAIATLCVQGFVGACLLQSDEALPLRVAAAAADRVEWADELVRWWALRVDPTQSEHETIVDACTGPDARALRELGVHTVLRVPLRAHGGVLGSLVLALGPGEGPCDEPLVSCAQALADRIATYAEHMRLFREAREARRRAAGDN